jgi:hypothetical protein
VILSRMEAWALEIVERVRTRQQVEDARVELKTTWPTPEKAARRLAGHANAARGEPILWIIGLDEKAGVVGAEQTDYAEWIVQVQSCFDSVAPDVTEVAVSLDGWTLMALRFDTSHPPYVISHAEGGAIQREVPWRDGTRVRSAKRHELLLLLSEQLSTPDVEPLWAIMDLGHYNADGNNCTIQFGIYVMPHSRDRVVIPCHRTTMALHSAVGLHCDFGNVQLMEPASAGSAGLISLSKTIMSTQREAIIDGPGELIAHVFNARLGDPSALYNYPVQLTLNAQPLKTPAAMTVSANLPYSGELKGLPGTHRWEVA